MAPRDVALRLRTLHTNDIGVCIGWIVAALLRSCHQHRLRRFKPQPEERHRCRSRDLFNGLPVSVARIHCIDDGAVTSANDQSSALSQRRIDARRHLRRVPSGTKALEKRDAGQALSRLVAAENDRTRPRLHPSRDRRRMSRLRHGSGVVSPEFGRGIPRERRRT